MDYQFTQSTYGVVAKCSMEHEAFAYWLNSEINDEDELYFILDKIKYCKSIHPNNIEWNYEGNEYSLYVNNDEVLVKANNLIFDMDNDVDEDFQLYTQESIAVCGIDDFEAFLLAYKDFVSRYH